MKRVLAVLSVLAVAAAVVLAVTGAGGGDRYVVRAIFDNAAFVIPGEDVKVAGVKVGKIDAVDVTRDFKAQVDLLIEDPAYRDFRKDASCIVRPQSLIGEKFVECEPTRKRAVGSPPAPALDAVAGEDDVFGLPVERNGRSVDLDLINTIMRRPFRERFSIILNEFGTGLAGRGADLDAVIRRSAPALRELDRVVKILADQNRVLRRLAVDSDRVLAPLARDRRRVTSFMANASETAQAAAERRGALAAGLQRFAPFLRELRPTMTRLGGFSRQATPVLADLGAVAPEIDAFIRDLGPFSQAALPALDTLGDVGEVGIPALRESLPVTRDVRAAARPLRPVSRTLAQVLTSVRRTGGIERLMDYIFFQVAAINGFDSFGHYLRAALLVNTCSTYTIDPVPGCLAKFGSARASAAAASAAPDASAGMPRDAALARTRRILAGESLADVLGARGAREARARMRGQQAAVRRLRAKAPPIRSVPAPPAPAGAAAPGAGAGGSVDTLLDYLFGGGG